MINSKQLLITSLAFLGFTTISGTLLASSFVSADNDSVVDQINITVPVSCTMSGTGMTSHNADISNGTYQANIGTTTLHAFCNDNSGFAIYAAGYTGDEIGGTNSNKLVGTSASGNATIVTGTAISAENPDVSNWAMKLVITQDSGDTTGTNAFAIDNSFSAYHEVPNEYAKVAHKNAGTDMTTTTGGVKLTTTYAAYISKTQPADTYSGQVKYTLVHPSSAAPPVEADQVGVIYHSNGQTFANGRTENRVVYGDSYTPMYIATTPEIIETSNLTNGVQDGGYTDGEYILETRTYDGAVQVRVEVVYGLTRDSAEAIAFDGVWDGDWDNWNNDWDSYGWIYSSDNVSSTRTYTIDGDTVTVFADSHNTPESSYDYGFHIKIYPIYVGEHENAIPMQTEYYIGNTPTIVKTPNIADDGTQNGAYYAGEYVEFLEPVSFTGADKVRVVLRHGLTMNTAGIIVAEGEWGGWNESDPPGRYLSIYSEDENLSGINTYTFDGDTVTFYMEAWDAPESGYDYGMYAEVYPVYETEQENTTPITLNVARSFDVQIGAYAETTDFGGTWILDSEDGRRYFVGEMGVIEYIEQNKNILAGTTINMYAGDTLTMQSVSVWKNGLALEQQVEAMDVRDGKMYTVAKLADDNVWMTQNLDLDLDSNTTYTNNDTDLGWNPLTNSYDSASWVPMRSTYETSSNNIHEWCKGGTVFSHGENCRNNTPESYDPGEIYWNGVTSDISEWYTYYDDCHHHEGDYIECDESMNPLPTYTTVVGNPDQHYHLGNYYNWPAAVASNDASIYNASSLEPHQSICPTGWTLPYISANKNTGEEGGDFANLWTAYGWDVEYGGFSNITLLRSAPLYYVPSGGFDVDGYAYHSALEGIGYDGYLWSFSPTDDWTNGSAYSVNYNIGVIDDINADYSTSSRGAGLSIRCIAR